MFRELTAFLLLTSVCLSVKSCPEISVATIKGHSLHFLLPSKKPELAVLRNN